MARATARQLARQLGVPDPIVRWFTEFDYYDPNKITLSGVAFPYYGAIYMNRGLPVRDIPYVAAHEVAHLRGYDSEDAADGFAARIVADHSGPTHGSSVGHDIVWRGSGAGWRETVAR